MEVCELISNSPPHSMIYLVVIHAGIKVAISQHWFGSGNRNDTLPKRWWYIMSYCTTFQTSDYFCSTPLYAPGPYLSLLAHACILFIWINADIYMSLYIITHIHTRFYSSILFRTLFLFLNSRPSKHVVVCQSWLGSTRLWRGPAK